MIHSLMNQRGSSFPPNIIVNPCYREPRHCVMLIVTTPELLPLGAAVFFGMPNSESESEFTVSIFLALGALFGLGGTSTFAVRS